MAWFDWIGRDRREERAATLAIMTAMADVAKAQAAAVAGLLESYKTTTPPVLREFDDVEATKRYMAKTYGDQIPEELLPAELRGKDLAGQFSALLDRLDEA